MVCKTTLQVNNQLQRGAETHFQPTRMHLLRLKMFSYAEKRFGTPKNVFCGQMATSVSETNFLDVQINVLGVQIASDCQKLI